jgi:glutamate-1-semialdehyde 2,1-aminomutase
MRHSARRSCALALQRGVYLHPKHNMFPSVANRAQGTDRALLATDSAFEALAWR